MSLWGSHSRISGPYPSGTVRVEEVVEATEGKAACETGIRAGSEEVKEEMTEGEVGRETGFGAGSEVEEEVVLLPPKQRLRASRRPHPIATRILAQESTKKILDETLL